MKKRFFLLFIYILLWHSTVAQEQKAAPLVERPLNALTFDLLSPVYLSWGPSNLSRWRLGYRHQLNKRWAIGADLGYGNSYIAIVMEGQDYVLYELRPELHYLLQLGQRTRVYFSAQPFYLIHTETLINRSVFIQEIGQVSFDSVTYQRNKYGLTLNYGFIFPMARSMGLNVSIGGGLRRRENSYKSFTNPKLEFYDDDHSPPYYDSDFPLTEFEFSFGVKVYFFTNNKIDS